MIEKLRELNEKGYVRGVRHLEFPLTVWNYTPIVQFDNVFGDYPLLRLCRGLVTDDNGNIAARGFEKFYNWEEHGSGELPCSTDKIEVTKKLDGSLLIVFRYNDHVVYTTRGSFYSDQAIAASKLFRELYDESWIEDGKSYLFEFIGPENRIVVSYPKMNLVHLALLDNSTGCDLERDSRFELVPVVEVEGGVFGGNLYEALKPLNIPNEEGFVIRQISDGTFPDWRCKIKFEDYVRLHKIITGITNTKVWEILKSGQGIDSMLEICPDEFNNWLRKVKTDLENQYSEIESMAILLYNEVRDIETRKEQAVYLLDKNRTLSGVVFKMLDNRPYNEVIWNMIKPSSMEQPWAMKEVG